MAVDDCPQPNNLFIYNSISFAEINVSPSLRLATSFEMINERILLLSITDSTSEGAFGVHFP